ncbi:hypothetical protein Anapl_02770 [Anas platyrhynchos]|uniref:Uncharacterized protein n=1 Tax=Anas platyrhynchos TaxID=8839 RepID=R0LS81_ANAPL|nr:hypothetical protein Anapl_02770 [Anas platyrhynchos]
MESSVSGLAGIEEPFVHLVHYTYPMNDNKTQTGDLRVRKGHTQIPVDHANTLTEPLAYEQKALLALFASVMNTHIQPTEPVTKHSRTKQVAALSSSRRSALGPISAGNYSPVTRTE